MFNRTTRNTSNRNTRTRWKRCSQLTINTPERHHWCCSVVFRCLGEDVMKTDWRHLEDVFSVTFFCLPRHLQDIIARCLLEDVLKMSWRRLEEDILQIRLGRRLERLEDFSRRGLANTSWRRLEELLTTSWRRLGRWKIVTLKASSRRLLDVLENKKCLLGWLLIYKRFHKLFWCFHC